MADRPALHWRLSAMPEVELRAPVRDITESLGLDVPNIWSEGGHPMKLNISLEVFVPYGATAPDVNEVAAAILDAMRGHIDRA